MFEGKKRVLVCTFLIILTSCSVDDPIEKKEVVVELKEATTPLISLEDTLFLSYRIGMNRPLINKTTKELIKNNKLENYYISPAYRFIFQNQEFIMPLEFYEDSSLQLNEIELNETEGFLVKSIGKKDMSTGVVFQESYRRELLKLYKKKYNFKKKVLTTKNQFDAYVEWDKEKQLNGIPLQMVDLPNGQKIMYYDEDGGVIVYCEKGYSAYNLNLLKFKSISISYVSENQMTYHLSKFDVLIENDIASERQKLEKVEVREGKRKQVINDI